jgi:hypothetical protein
MEDGEDALDSEEDGSQLRCVDYMIYIDFVQARGTHGPCSSSLPVRACILYIGVTNKQNPTNLVTLVSCISFLLAQPAELTTGGNLELIGWQGLQKSQYGVQDGSARCYSG